MIIGAVITAAGMSSRMEDFKPLLNIGSISIAQRVITTLKQAGVEIIVVVTGYRADDLEHELAQNRVMFLRNENPATTEMFDSAVIGLKYLQDKCSHILFTPVDIPLFTLGTVQTLLATEGDIVVPICAGQTGHPILLSGAIAAKVCRSTGEGGLRTVLKSLGPITYAAVTDEGILHDADTPNDFAELVAFHNRQLLRPIIDVKLAGEKQFFGARLALLLFIIDSTNSMLTACKQMQISYSSGWKLINFSEKELGFPLVQRSQGGTKGGKTTLTPAGHDLLMRYRKFSSELRKTANVLFKKYFQDILIK